MTKIAQGGTVITQLTSATFATASDYTGTVPGNETFAYDANSNRTAAHLHHRAVQIHPFLNGNGRWSRLLANIWLKLHKATMTEWSEKAIGGESKIRGDNLAAIRGADFGNYGPLIELHHRFAAK